MRIAIIGLGLIGGSLGLALKGAKETQIQVVGFARRPETAAEAVRRGVVDRTEPELSQAVSGSDIVVLATPVVAMQDILRQIAEQVSPHTIVTDVGSTKTQIVRWAREYLPPQVDFIGGHPMAGKETAGLEQAEPALFEDCTYCLTPSDNASPQAVKAMERLAAWVGARPFIVDAERHDELVAGISHLPLVLSSALMSALAQSPLWGQMSELAATGFKDMTRLASGSPELHRGICATNQEAIAKWIDRYIDALKEYKRLVTQDDQGLLKSFREAQETRQQWLENEGRRFNR